VDEAEERALVQRVAAGDRAAFALLLQQHQRSLSAYARRMLGDAALADDMVQETFLRLWSRADRFDGRASRLTTWLHRICHNLCVDSHRRQGRERALDDSADPVAGQNPEGESMQEERGRRVRAALTAIPERQRSALLLCHYQGLSNREAASILDVSVEALESLLARGRRQLRKLLESEL
jgi:RNA polymerase sigma-70 factor (ECF subfamily)